jgi:hypothetical protein
MSYKTINESNKRPLSPPPPRNVTGYASKPPIPPIGTTPPSELWESNRPGFFNKLLQIFKQEQTTEIPMDTEQPPLGVMPRHIWEDEQRQAKYERMMCLISAIARYHQHNDSCKIPSEWFFELSELLKEYLTSTAKAKHFGSLSTP